MVEHLDIGGRLVGGKVDLERLDAVRGSHGVLDHSQWSSVDMVVRVHLMGLSSP
jgi:hypothetical protein